MADDKKPKDKEKKPKEKKPSPFRNGIIVGIILGIFVGWIIPVPGPIQEKKAQVAQKINEQKKKAFNEAGESMIQGGKALKDESGHPVNQQQPANKQ